jgi:NAD(P)-dependent dehydrogenase (short-subunit alcohol dehydrogenase family)
MSDGCLQDRVVVLTGGAGLLGRNYSQALSSAGAHVIVADIDHTRANAVVEALPGVPGMAVSMDVTSPASIRQMVEKVNERFGHIDALVNNAAIDPKFDILNGGAHTHSFEEYPLELWQQSLNVNLTGAFLCTQAIAPFLMASERGSVVNVASVYGIVGPDQRLYRQDGMQLRFKPVGYSVAKSALIGLTKYLASYWAGSNLRVKYLDSRRRGGRPRS